MKYLGYSSVMERISSLPTRERGLKSGLTIEVNTRRTVTPHAGAWIKNKSEDYDRIIA